MIPTLALLFLCYFSSIFLSLSPEGILLTVILAVGYSLYFGFLCRKPHYSLYAFLLLQVLFPRGQMVSDYSLINDKTYGVYPFLIVELISCLPIIIQLSKRKASLGRSLPNMRFFVACVFWSCVSLFVLETVRQVSGSVGFEYVDKSAFIKGSTFFCCFVFLFGCTELLESIQQMEGLLIIVLLAGFELFLEGLLYQVLRLPLPRAETVSEFGPEGRFFSLVFGSYSKLVNVSFAAIGACLYFTWAKRKYYLSLAILPLFLPIFLTLQRAPMMAGALIPAVFVVLFKKSTKYLAIVSILFLGVYSSYDVIQEYVVSRNVLKIAETRSYYFKVENYMGSWANRVGAEVRGLELFVASFPLGIGVDDTRFNSAMSSPSVAMLLEPLVPRSFDNVLGYYHLIASNKHSTDPHNWFIKFIVEYGAVGLLTVCSLFAGYVSRLKHFLRNTYVSHNTTKRDLAGIRVTGLAVLPGMMFYFLFQAVPLYSLIFLFYYLSFFRIDQPKKVVTR